MPWIADNQLYRESRLEQSTFVSVILGNDVSYTRVPVLLDTSELRNIFIRLTTSKNTLCSPELYDGFMENCEHFITIIGSTKGLSVY